MSRLVAAAIAAGSFWYGTAALAQSNPEALQWLQRIYTATDGLSYTGTFVYQHGDHVETSRITRIVDSAGVHERVETLDGPPREIVRENDEVKCYLPQVSKVKIDSQRETKPFPSMRGDQLKDIAEQYTIRKGEIERIAGYDCQALILEPKDNLRYGHKLWADVNTGMLVKAKTFNDKRELIEQFAFTQLQLGGRIDKDLVKSRFADKGRAWRVEVSGVTPADLSKSGWTLKSLPPGYKKIAELRRNMGETRDVGHIVVSDGLAAISVFIETLGAKTAQARVGPMKQGVLNVYTRKFDSHLVTVVGEVPGESVRAIAEAIEYRPPS
ncbi:MAG TPA: MucB/RseB C-terminal domain-containing protein [Burkholderiales bacterium]|nr:MucB/RseB C-terminal domain-containing protein [Burkholderiales bacterium]